MRRRRVPIFGRWPFIFRFVPVLSLAACGVHGYQAADVMPADVMPTSASEYARLVTLELGVVPTIDCGDGVRVPIVVEDVEVFEDQEAYQCDNHDFKGTCLVGSRVGRLEGKDANGTALPDVVWVYFCRSQGVEALEKGVASVQMIGHNIETGATAFFESPDADPTNTNDQTIYLRFDENGLLDGELPGPEDPEFDVAFIPPPMQCSQCHQADPFIHTPWIDGARLPSDPSQPVVPEVAKPDSPYYIVGGPSWDQRTVHIEGNGCTRCHRAPDPERFLGFTGLDVNSFMPPNAPGTMAVDYAAIRACYDNGPEATPGCYWVGPPESR